jgi:hypothetical protein
MCRQIDTGANTVTKASIEGIDIGHIFEWSTLEQHRWKFPVHYRYDRSLELQSSRFSFLSRIFL